MDPRLLFNFLFGLIGGTGAYLIGVPLPFLFGGILGTASFVLFYEREGRELPKLTIWLRKIFMAVIGAMVGSRFSPELVTLIPQFWISGLAIVAFIIVAQSGNYFIMRKLGGYDKLDAYFAALPGGLVDAVALAEQAGANVPIVTVQHFIRIILVVSTVPLLFYFLQGSAVGSMAGETMAVSEYSIQDIVFVFIIALAGIFGGQLLRLPVAHLVGPLILALIISVSGFATINIPEWLQHLAQYMIGVSLGSQFSGVSRHLLVRGIGMGILSTGYMLCLAGIFASILMGLVPAGFDVLFISFAAGGLAEMSLIALSLNFNPVVVALHHLARIFFTIWIGNFLANKVLKLNQSHDKSS